MISCMGTPGQINKKFNEQKMCFFLPAGNLCPYRLRQPHRICYPVQNNISIWNSIWTIAHKCFLCKSCRCDLGLKSSIIGLFSPSSSAAINSLFCRSSNSRSLRADLTTSLAEVYLPARISLFMKFSKPATRDIRLCCFGFACLPPGRQSKTL